jgi:hypothetical protein
MKLKLVKFPRPGMIQMVVRTGAGFMKFPKLGHVSSDLPDNQAAIIMAEWDGCFEIVREEKKKTEKMTKAPKNKGMLSPETR